MRCQRCGNVRELEWMEGHCCECGNPIPTNEQRLTNGHLRCEFCSHPPFREQLSIDLVEEHLLPEKPPAHQKESRDQELVPITVENHPLPSAQTDTLPTKLTHHITRPLERATCTCDGTMREPDPESPGCCVICGGVIDPSEVILFESQRRDNALRNGLTSDSRLQEKQSTCLVHRLLDALKPK